MTDQLAQDDGYARWNRATPRDFLCGHCNSRNMATTKQTSWTRYPACILLPKLISSNKELGPSGHQALAPP